MSTSAIPPQEGIIAKRIQVGQPEEMPLQHRRWLILATVAIGTIMQGPLLYIRETTNERKQTGC